MYVNVFVKNIGVSRMVERLGESEETCYLSFNRNSSALAVNLVINHYFSESCNDISDGSRVALVI